MRGRGGGAHAGKNNLNNIFFKIIQHEHEHEQGKGGAPPPARNYSDRNFPDGWGGLFHIRGILR